VKYMGCWVLSFSWTTTELSALADVAMYIMRGRLRSGLVRIGGVVSSCFKVVKLCSQVSSQTNRADFFSNLIIGWF